MRDITLPELNERFRNIENELSGFTSRYKTDPAVNALMVKLEELIGEFHQPGPELVEA